jgi:membrane glycosyltransferase
MAPLPNYFPEPYQLFPVFPDDRTKEITALALGIVGLLIFPKFAILAEAAYVGRVQGFGGVKRAFFSVLTEILLSSLLAPIMLMYQTRAVLQVLSGRDGGWPANQRGDGRLTLAQGFAAGAWIMATGGAALALVLYVAPDLVMWLLPVCVPMLLAPLLITFSSWPLTHSVFTIPEEAKPAPVAATYARVLDRWMTQPAQTGENPQGSEKTAKHVAA